VSVPAGKVPILESVQTAWRDAARLAPALAPAGLLAAGASILTVLFTRSLGGSPIAQLLATAMAGFAMTLFTTPAILGALGGSATLNATSVQRALKLYAAMSIVGFFLLILFVVAAIPGIIALGVALAPHAKEMEAASGDVAATLAFLNAHPEPFVAIGLLYAVLWLAVTSRLYLAAPASVSEDRVATFETWRWTQGNLLRISAARLLALVPLALAASLVQFAVQKALGFDPLDPVAMSQAMIAQPAKFAAAALVSSFANLMLYASSEATLSAYLYRGLKPPA
jgi:hypothetical protein